MIHRIINFPEKQSFFLFGPRQTGKTTLINNLFQQISWKIDLLLNEPFLLYSKDPGLFRRQVIEKITVDNISTIVVDEVQRVPALLSEVHYLIEQYPQCRFVLTGSSPRKLKRKGNDLLAGRAVERFLFPYVFEEIKDRFKLDEALRYGTLPAIIGKQPEEMRDILDTYARTYLTEEIKAEGISRNIGGFSRFLEVAAGQNGELVSFSGAGRECGLPTRTVQSYYEILEDTLIGFRLMPYKKSIRKRLVSHPKFYLFDMGVVNALNRRLTAGLDPVSKGRLFEHFILLETRAMIHYLRSEAQAFFWRTGAGAEVDLLIEKHGSIIAACEIKSTPVIDGSHLTGLKSFSQEHPGTPLYLVGMTEHAYQLDRVQVLPWQSFLEKLKSWL